ncbi:hypothetical protein MW887_008944 [Aspergillus wentii]|nr:hypothetical protein MW887_008944 [Aspergillus wentii]
MGKLNYSARKIEGTKAGQVVSKDLKKRITPGTGSKAAARDPTLEIDLTAKGLTDDGFSQFIDDLIDCIKYRDAEHPEGAAKLAEFHLQGNQLSVQSLPKLAEVIALSAGELRELDLSKNSIEITTPEQKLIWQQFLESFGNCYMLKKLDLGSNPLGSGGMEIFARVYIQSDLDFVEDDASAIIVSKSDSDDSGDVDDVAASPSAGKENKIPQKDRAKRSPSKTKSSRQNGRSHAPPAAGKTTPTQADLKRFACTRGLRSVPFLILSDTSPTAGCAIHFASILPMHRTREQLLSFLPGGKALALPETVSRCKGIIWLPNDGLGQLGHKLLDMVETMREQTSGTDSDEEELDEEEQLSTGFGQLRTIDSSNGNGKLDITAQRKLQAKMNVEYSRLCKRVRMEALKVEWVHSAEIWSTALRMMVVARSLLLDDKDRAVEVPEEEEEKEEMVPEVEHIEEVGVENDFPEYEYSLYEVVEPTIIGPFQPGAETFEENFPALQVVSEGHKETPIYPTKEEKRMSSPQQHTPRSGKGHQRAVSTLPAPQKYNWRFRFPLECWRRIIADAVGAEGILDVQQQLRIIRYAADWDSVAYELTIKGAEEYQQIWKFLETVGCFTYSPLS